MRPAAMKPIVPPVSAKTMFCGGPTEVLQRFAEPGPIVGAVDVPQRLGAAVVVVEKGGGQREHIPGIESARRQHVGNHRPVPGRAHASASPALPPRTAIVSCRVAKAALPSGVR